VRTELKPPFDPSSSSRRLGFVCGFVQQRAGLGRGVLGLALLAILASALACSEPALEAHWRQREIRVDGALADWQGWQVSLPEADARLAVANDESYLYLSLATSNPDLVRQLSRHGLTVWFDSAGGRAQGLGLRLPPPGLRGLAGRPGPVEMLGTSPGQHRWVTGAEAEALGVSSAVAHEGSLVYELRVPLAGKEAWSLKLGAGGRLGIGLATPEGFGSPADEMKAWERGWAAGGAGPSPEGPGVGEGPVGPGVRNPVDISGVAGPTGGGFGGPGGPVDREGRSRETGERGGSRREPLELWAVVRLAGPGSH
jgi:hypothetical protein